MMNMISKGYLPRGLATVATLLAGFAHAQAEDAGPPVDAGADDPASQCLEPQLPVCSDGQVEAILRAANQSEVDLVSSVIARLTTPSVREYAEHIRDDHTLALQELAALIATTGVQPQENDVSEGITESGQLQVERLQQKSGADLERDFIARVLLSHHLTLSAADHLLVPSAQGAELVQFLQALRPVLVEHTESAADVQAEVAGACGGDTSTEPSEPTTEAPPAPP